MKRGIGVILILLVFAMGLLLVSCPTEIEVYQVIFNSQGGSSPNPESKNVIYDQTYGTLPTVTKTGYTFGGWWTGAGGTGTQILSTTTVSITTDQTLYAKWTFVPYIGPSGGYVFYENPNYATDGWRYMEAAPAGWSGDATDPGYRFGYYRPEGTNVVVGTALGIGSGKGNTEALVTAMVSAAYSFSTGVTTTEHYAAKMCADYRGGGHADWFLPSKDELNLMYQNLVEQNLGGFSVDGYWSSSEVDADNAWDQFFGDGGQFYSDRHFEDMVRPVRAF